MCGIAGQFCFHGPAAPLDLRLIAHRGPDASGEWFSDDRRVWLGNTRLAILDLSPAGAQPMIDPGSGNVLVMNGEIYNHLQLRREMPDVAWQGTSDTETLLQAYARWGRQLLVRLKGMFAFALYDQARQELFLARDRLGIKPLYFAANGDGIRFASETKMLTADDDAISPAAVAAYLQWGACPEDRLLFCRIEALRAGHAMIVRRDGSREVWRYWPAQTEFISPSTSAPQKIRELLEIAVEEHLLSDVPVASFLSGGIDSSIVTALAAQKLGRNLQTFSVGFDLAEFDESAIARAVAERYGTTHRQLQLSEDEVLQSVTEAVAHFDLPSVDAINTYIVSRAVAREGVKVALSGLGGDELFGGYPSFRDVPRLQVLAKLPPWLRRVFSKRLADLPNESDPLALAQWRRRFFSEADLLRAGLPNESFPLPCPIDLPDDFARISWAELTGYMRHMLLRDADQMSMAVSLELRVPFLDHELVEYSLGLPAAEKQCHGGSKGLLVAACRDLLPPAVYDRPKRGFSLPMAQWMNGPLAVFVEEGLREIVARKILPNAFVAQAGADFRAGRLHWTRLWSMVVLGHFVRRRMSPRRPDENIALHSFA